MATKDIDYLNNLNMNGLQIKGMVIEKVTSIPTALDGKFIYLTADQHSTEEGHESEVLYTAGLYYCKGSAWTLIGTGGDVEALATRVSTLEGNFTDSTVANTYAKTQVNAEGIVVGGSTTIGVSDIDSTSKTATGGTASDSGKIPLLNASGQIANTMIPPLAIAELVEFGTGVAHTKANLITLSTAEKGDIAVVDEDTTANNNGVYFLTGTYSTLANWVQIVGPSNVISVDGQTGVVDLSGTYLGINATADKATADASGNVITTTYATKTELGGKMSKLASTPSSAGAVVVSTATDDAVAVSTSTLGSATKPIYLSSGVLTEGTQIGNAGYKGVTVEGSSTGSVITSSSTDDNVPTDKAVYNFVNNTVGAYYTKTEIQGYFISQSITTASDGSGGYSATVNVTSGVPFMAQLIDGDGDVVQASITIGASTVVVNTNSAFTGTLKVLAMPSSS